MSWNLPSITTHGDLDGSGKCSKMASHHALYNEGFDNDPSLLLGGKAIRMIFLHHFCLVQVIESKSVALKSVERKSHPGI